LTVFLASCDDDDDAPLAISSFNHEASGDLEFGIPLNVQFIDMSTNTDARTIYAWDFGDGATSAEKNPVHVYEKGGAYTVKLVLTNADGKTNESSKEIELSSPLVGTWKLDSVALSTIDSLAAKGFKTSMEFGNGDDWDGKKWTSVADDNQGTTGYSKFWSHSIFGGNYIGRHSFFEVKYTFTADGKYIRDENDKLFGVVYFPEERDYLESEDWKNPDGISINAWKSGEYSWEMLGSDVYEGQTDLQISGSDGGFLGIYFAGSELTMPAEVYNYTIALVNDDQLIVSGISNLFGPQDVFVLKFKKVTE
jgi:PKD repeat protein